MKLNLKALYEVFGSQLTHTEIIKALLDGELVLINEYGEVGYADGEDLKCREENGNTVYINGDTEFILTKRENDIALYGIQK